MNTRNCVVIVRSAVAEHELYSEDVGLDGVYLVGNLGGDLTDEQACDVALDAFHLRYPVKRLDDFDIRVIDSDKMTEITPEALGAAITVVAHCEKISDEVPQAFVDVLDAAAPDTLSQSKHDVDLTP